MKLLSVLSVAAALLVSAASADTIVTQGGSTINGKILGIDGGKIKVATDFAGEITIDQSKVASLTTDEPIYLTLEDGSTYLGPVTGNESGLTIASQNGAAAATVATVTESWNPGQKSPTTLRKEAEIKSLQRKWAYEAAFDLTGKSGNKSSNGLGTNFRATLKGAKDTLSFFARANFQEVDGDKSADNARGGVDYSNKFSKHYNWYVRSEFGYDAVKDIEQLFTVAAGFGYIFSDTETRELSIRGGAGYLFESYDDLLVGYELDENDLPILTSPIYAMRPDKSTASLDLGLSHKETLKWGTWVNRTTFTPSIDELSNFRLIHDTSFELPLKSEGWSVRTGINFDYDSEAELSDKEELDTTYYVRMVLKWD